MCQIILMKHLSSGRHLCRYFFKWRSSRHLWELCVYVSVVRCMSPSWWHTRTSFVIQLKVDKRLIIITLNSFSRRQSSLAVGKVWWPYRPSLSTRLESYYPSPTSSQQPMQLSPQLHLAEGGGKRWKGMAENSVGRPYTGRERTLCSIGQGAERGP